jgi:hypothetical protein
MILFGPFESGSLRIQMAALVQGFFLCAACSEPQLQGAAVYPRFGIFAPETNEKRKKLLRKEPRP